MLRFRPSGGLHPQPCRLKHLFEFTQTVRAHKPWFAYLSLRAGRNVQHPERHFQNPAVLIFQAAVGHSPASFYQARMHPYCPAMPGMPRVANFTDIPNMGVALLSCITLNETIKARATFYSSRPPASTERVTEQSYVVESV
jgi:hypothetical protein